MQHCSYLGCPSVASETLTYLVSKLKKLAMQKCSSKICKSSNKIWYMSSQLLLFQPITKQSSAISTAHLLFNWLIKVRWSQNVFMKSSIYHRKNLIDFCPESLFRLGIRRLVGSIKQAKSSGFYFRIVWKSTERPSFLWNCSLSFLRGLRSTNIK